MSAPLPAADALHAQRALWALWALVGLAFAIGTGATVVAAGRSDEPPWWTLAYNAGFGALTYAWVHFDSARRGFRLPLPARIGVVLLAVVALPWYLIATRAGAERWAALLRLVGFFALLVLAATFGAVLATVLL